MKSHSSFLTLSSLFAVLYQIERPPLRPLPSAPRANLFCDLSVDVFPKSVPVPAIPAMVVRYDSRKASPGMSQMRSHGRSRKSDLMTLCTSGNLSSSAVGVLNSRSGGRVDRVLVKVVMLSLGFVPEPPRWEPLMQVV